ncbi:MAG TPA: ATP-binding protein [Gemmatimonadales bacterium]|nr:ATP-binding protein [Gemmatimonadales bacterium]
MNMGTAIRPALEVAATGLLVLDERWRIVWANAALVRMVAIPLDKLAGSRPWDVLPGLASRPEARAVKLTRTDGQPRTFRIGYRDQRISGVFDVRVALAENRNLLLEVHDVSSFLTAPSELHQDEEGELLRILSRTIDASQTSDSMLTVLVELTRRATGAPAIAVTAAEGDNMVVLHASGGSLPQAGTTLPLEGTITARVAEQRAPVRSSPYESKHTLLTDMVEASRIGEVVGVPLVVFERVVGSLFVGMPVDAPPLSNHAIERMRVLAEHAALPIWRALLLEQARAADLAKTNFLATVSHELRTPLTALAGYGELLADGILGPLSAQQTETVERMRAVTGHLASLIDEILAYSNLEGGREHVHPSSVCANVLARQVAHIAEPLASQKELEFVLDLPEDEISFVSDGQKVRQILVNLAANAVKFTEQGRVTMRVRREKDAVCFSVEDTGRGIAPSDHPRLFQPFGQLDEGLTRSHGGIGLGLYVSRRLAGLVRGRIEVAPRAGGGSVFKLLLPLAGLPG